MTLPKSVHDFIQENHKGVLATYRRDGTAQLSIVVCGPYRDGVGLSTTQDRAKYANLVRDPRCSLLVSRDSWWGYVVVEGRAQVMSPGNTDPEALRQARRDVYRASGGGEHPNWQEFDEAMERERRVVVVVRPERIYGTIEGL